MKADEPKQTRPPAALSASSQVGGPRSQFPANDPAAAETAPSRTDRPTLSPTVSALVAAAGGFAILLLEIVGARYLARDFGSSFYVWVSQIGVVMIALALGYYVGGAVADRWQRPGFLAWLLWPTALFVWAIPWFAPHILESIVNRHPADEPVAPVWQKLDPALGSAVVFLWPCFVLAMLSPFLIRLTSRRLAHVGRISGLIIAASTVGSIAGVFVAGYLLVDLVGLSTIFRWTGAGIGLLGVACAWLDRGLRRKEKGMV